MLFKCSGFYLDLAPQLGTKQVFCFVPNLGTCQVMMGSSRHHLGVVFLSGVSSSASSTYHFSWVDLQIHLYDSLSSDQEKTVVSVVRNHLMSICSLKLSGNGLH